MGCASGTIKCILNTMNFLLLVLGGLLIAVASVSINSMPQSYIIYLFIVGGINVLVALLGCCGICKEDVCLTKVYAGIILFSFIAQIFGKYFATSTDAIKKFASDDVDKIWLKEIQYPGAMNNTQQTFLCCGKDSPNDYYTIHRPRLPPSCYSHYNTTLPENNFKQGCIEGAQTAFLNMFQLSSSSEWGSLIYTAIMFAFAYYLVVRFSRKQRRYNYN